MWQQEKLAKALKDNLVKFYLNADSIAKEVIIDSRVKSNDGLFIALRGENNDGHNFLNQAFANGAVMAIVEEIPAEFQNDNSPINNRFILVKNSTQALKELAIYARAIFQGKIIGVTGSVGKTSIKEMLKTVLGFAEVSKKKKNKVFATVGNLNNHFGLPLSLSNLPEDYDYGILEMGMNHLGEIKFLTEIARPNIAIISTIAAAHIGNFKNEEEIALAKSEIFYGLADGGFVILNQDNQYYDFLKNQALKHNIKEDQIISFGKARNSSVRLESLAVNDADNSEISVKIKEENKVSYKINSINEAVMMNSLIVIAALSCLEEELEDYLPAFMQLQILPGRGNILKISKNNLNLTIINDSYNANLASMIAGLKFLSDLKKQHPASRSVAVIGDMLELGANAVGDHQAIAAYIEEFNIDKVLLVGELCKNIIPLVKKDKIIGHFATSADLANNIIDLLRGGDILLVKGSRGTKMEKIIDKLCS